MFKQSIPIICLISFVLTARAQSVTLHRYKDAVFTDVAITKDLSYADTLADDKKAHIFDLYQPKEDRMTKRPLIIWMHGGGFKFGSKNAKGIVLWSTTFAQRGYVCVALNYRLSKKNPLFNFGVLKQASYYAVQDAKTAVAFFRKHSEEYHIDPDKIILAGNSAGGMIALQAAYASNAELAKSCGLPDTVAGAKNREMFKVAGVINYWGGIYNLSWLKNARVAILSVVGSNDHVVKPASSNGALYGSIDIRDKADELHIPNQLKVFDGYSHELEKHFNPIFSAGKATQKRWLEAGQFTADFFYNTLFK